MKQPFLFLTICMLAIVSCGIPKTPKEQLIDEMKDLGIKTVFKVNIPQLEKHMYIATSEDSVSQDMSLRVTTHIREVCDTCYIFSFTEVRDWTSVEEEDLKKLVERGRKSTENL